MLFDEFLIPTQLRWDVECLFGSTQYTAPNIPNTETQLPFSIGPLRLGLCLRFVLIIDTWNPCLLKHGERLMYWVLYWIIKCMRHFVFQACR